MTTATPAPPREPASARPPADRITLGALVVALLLFAVALARTNQDAMNGFGLVSVLGWQFFAALVLTCYAAAREFSRRTLRTGHMTAVAVVLIVILFGVQNLSDSAAGFATSWLHVGFADYIADNGKTLLFYDARFSWPGFFATAASMTALGGASDAVSLLRWSPVAYNLLTLLPMVLLARHATSRAHVAWLGILLYYCANWYEQDYFSPQATNLVLYLITIALLLWLAHSASPGTDVGPVARVRRWWGDGLRTSWRRLTRAVLHDRPPRVPGLGAGQYVALELALVAVIGASVVSHQLTPVAMILALTAFSLTARTRFKGLWLVAGVLFIAWFSYGATDYWFGHLSTVIGDVGQGGSTLKSGVSERISGDPDHLHVQFLRLMMAAGFGLLACVGLFLRRRSPWLPLLAALTFGPFLLLGLQSYGGEIVIRCFLFATPLLTLLAAETAGFLFRMPRHWVAAAMMLILLTASVLQVTARGANQPFERITADQVDAVRAIEANFGPDPAVGYFNDFNPLAVIKPDEVYLADLTACTLPSATARKVEKAGNGTEVACAGVIKPDWIFATSSQQAYGTLVEGRPVGWLDDITKQLVATGAWSVIIDEPHVTVLQRKGAETAATTTRAAARSAAPTTGGASR